MYFCLDRISGIIDIEQFDTLDTLIEQKLQDKNPDNIIICNTAEEFMGTYPYPHGRMGILVIQGEVLSVRATQHTHTTWNIGKKENG